MRTTHGTILLAALLAGFGCDNNPPVETPDSGPVVLDDAGPGTDACAACPRDSGPTGDGNDSFATATAITPGATSPTAGEINPAGDLDYYTFEGTAGQWIQILATTDDMATTRADTVIGLYDSTMTLIAENDDALPRFDVDPGLITRLPSAGTYYILVQEWSTWADDTAAGGPAYDYEVSVGEISPTAALVNIDTEGGDDAASAQALTEQVVTGGGASFIMGTFDDATDVDVFSFTITGTTSSSYSVNLMPEGNEAYGAAAPPARLRITNADGTETVASMDPSAFSPVAAGTNVDLAPSLPPGDYLLFVEGGGSADFYVIKAFRGGDNPPETMDATNGDATTPEVIPLTANPEITGLRSGFILANIGDGDTDYYSITTMGTEQITVSCGSRSLGSGVVDLTVALFDSTGATEIGTAVIETETEGALIEDRAVSSAGTYLVRLTKASQDPEVTSTFVRCGFHVQPPAP
jgi:hypothetical protein